MNSRRDRRTIQLVPVILFGALWPSAVAGIDTAPAQTAPPFVIRILEPSAATPVSAQPVLVRGTVEPPDPDLRVTVNAEPTLILQAGQWATLLELPAGTHELVVEARARGAIVGRAHRRVTVARPVPAEWPLLFRGGAPWAGMGMDRAVPVGTAPFEWTFRMAWWGGVTEGELDPEGAGGVTHSLRAGGAYTHRFLAPGIYAPRLRYADPAGRVWIQQGLVLVFDRAWLEPILQARWRDFLTALAQNDLDKAGKLVEVTRQDRFLPWREFLTPQQWKKVAAALGSEPLTWFGLEGYLATFRFGATSEGIEFAPDQLDGGWRYYFREGHLLGALMYQGN